MLLVGQRRKTGFGGVLFLPTFARVNHQRLADAAQQVKHPRKAQVYPALVERARDSERHRGEGLMASRAEMASGTGAMHSQLKPAVFGEKYWQRWVRSYPDIARKFYPELMD